MTALAKLKQIMIETGINGEDMRVLCFSEFGKYKFSELTDTQQWGLIHLIDPDAVGPYNHSMARFN